MCGLGVHKDSDSVISALGEGTNGWLAGQRRDLSHVLQSSLCLLCGGDGVGRSEYREVRKDMTAAV